MDLTREERQQQRELRLRGAQRRQVKEVDFGFSFPAFPALEAAPAQDPLLPRRTPQPELPPQLSRRRTPSSRGRGRSLSVPTEDANNPIIPSANDANTSAKRRKLENDEAPPSTSTRSTRSFLHAPLYDVYAIPEDAVAEPAMPDVTKGLVEQQLEESAPILDLRAATPPTLQNEVTESPNDAPGSGLRKCIGLNAATLRSSRLQNAVRGEDPSKVERPGGSRSGSSQRKRTRDEVTPKPPGPSKRSRRSEATSSDVAVDELDQLSPEPLTSEVSILRPVVERDLINDALDELSPEPKKRWGRKSKPAVKDAAPEIEEDVTEESLELAEEFDDQEAAAILKKNRRRRVSRNVPREESLDLDEITEDITIPVKNNTKRRQVATTPAKQSHPKKPTEHGASKHMKKPNKPARKVRLGSPIPVTVHRLTGRLYYEEDATDADILNSEIPYTKRGVNAVDVLSQMCHEIISSTLETLESGIENAEEKALKREYKRKWHAVDAFGKELQNRFVEHTINLDNTLSLEKRVRDEQKKKLALRDDILRIRAEREQIALSMDEVRIRHESEMKFSLQRDTLNTSMHDIELAVERGKANQVTDEPVKLTGIELLLKRVAGEVSNKSDSGGMLKQIKDFNGFLERAALALEARKG